MVTRPFLNVSCSATGRVWRDRCDERQQNAALAMAQSQSMPQILVRVLVGRGIDVSKAQDFINPTLRALMPDPSSFTDMDKVAARLVQAIEKKEKIAIFADYDVDGACSGAMLHAFLSFFSMTPRIYIPDRLGEGYGPNNQAMRMLANEGASLIITVDCGSLSDEPIAVAGEIGADVIVLDHHQMGGEIPSSAYGVVNPNRPDDLSAHGFLCAAGVVFITLVAVLRLLRAKACPENLPDLLALLDLVALASVCDVVPLVGVNRAFVVKGLQVMRAGQRCGLVELFKAAHVEASPNPFHLGFVLGPRINAGGRIGNPALGVELLTCQDPQKAARLAAELDNLNKQRQLVETQQLREAEAQAALLLERYESSPILVVASPHWHVGIIGLLAARLRERYHRPAIVLSIRPDGMATGSARSCQALDIGALVRKAVAVGLLDKGGGHAMAAGLSLPASSIENFCQWCMLEMAGRLTQNTTGEPVLFDGVLSAGGVSVELCEQLEKAGPFGSNFDEPIFALPSHLLVDIREVGQGHLSLGLANRAGVRLKAIAFRAVGTILGDFLLAHRGHIIHVAGCVTLNHWNGRTSAQLRLIDAALPD